VALSAVVTVEKIGCRPILYDKWAADSARVDLVKYEC